MIGIKFNYAPLFQRYEFSVRSRTPLLINANKLHNEPTRDNPPSLEVLTEQLAERDTELLRIRLECQRLNKLVKSTQTKGDYGQYQQHKRRNMELEKEVDNVKWQLKAVGLLI